eukprot:7625846-Prorocentrum_lima.AAC.1
MVGGGVPLNMWVIWTECSKYLDSRSLRRNLRTMLGVSALVSAILAFLNSVARLSITSCGMEDFSLAWN